MARPLTSQGARQTAGPRGVIKRLEFVKIITRALYSVGYDKMVSLFMQQVMDEQWDESVATLHKIGILDKKTMKLASFLLWEQKLLKLLNMDNVIVPLHINLNCVHELAACVISPSWCLIFGQDDEGANSRTKILEKLQKLLLIQRDSCVFHNILDSDLSLYSDHQCGRNQIPSQTAQILEAHNDEVWPLQFSHNGKNLASSSKDKSAIIWEIKEDGQVSLKHILKGHQKPVLTVSWNPDDTELLTCGREGIIRRWDTSSGECIHVYEKAAVGLVSCGWVPDGVGIFWDLDGKELECWKGQRTVRISDTRRIITSFLLSKDNKFLLVNLINQEIHLWSIEGNPKILLYWSHMGCLGKDQPTILVFHCRHHL
ncbi:hypothetical protein P3X46_011384 [Hevea brasiliensis]|uniref:LisH domain-containing protein n=1 Tax=Hevea brasiliensis TaxID=3981 RepID=A0ABQ9MH00_HEVBR|nr:hypothetical protein P3X46_011384 [Hevea brasiliensis]